jgi:purine-binding chemotaxis protein CheW
MRPLPIESVAGTPGFVRGVSVIRGAPTPVIDVGALLENREPSTTYGRLVTLKVGERRVAIGVDGVVGVRNLDSTESGELPPLLGGAAAAVIEAIGARDAQLLVVLRAASIVPDDVWRTLAAATR